MKCGYHSMPMEALLLSEAANASDLAKLRYFWAKLSSWSLMRAPVYTKHVSDFIAPVISKHVNLYLSYKELCMCRCWQNIKHLLYIFHSVVKLELCLYTQYSQGRYPELVRSMWQRANFLPLPATDAGFSTCTQLLQYPSYAVIVG